MMAFSRVAYVCKCPTRARGPAWTPDGLSVRLGGVDDLARLPDEIGGPARAVKLGARLLGGELLVIGELQGRVASCTWLRRGGAFALHHLPERSFRLGPGVGYGYDAWTDPALRGRGIRQAVFAEELRILAERGDAWEVSYFVDHQLEGGKRTLERIGAPLTALWKVAVRRDGSVALTALCDDGAVTPCFEYVPGEA